MCGIFGFVARRQDQNHIKLAENLFRLSESRGMEAAGFLSLTEHAATLYKSPVRGTELIKSQALQNCFDSELTGSLVFIGHSRLATNGRETDNHNNQPVLSDNIACVHNGIIVNDDDLWKKYPGLKRKFRVDTEIIPALFCNFLKRGANPTGAVSRVFREIRGAASVCVAPLETNYLIFATNTGSLYTGRGKGDILIFASEEYILQKLGADQIKQIPAGSGQLVIYKTGEIFNFKLSKPQKISLPNVSVKRRFTDYSEYQKPVRFGRRLNNLNTLKRHEPDYQKIKSIKRCTRCILPVTMPLIEFDDRGVCNFCRTYEPQKPAGLKTLEEYVQPFRRTDGKPDCIVALSGGRDSSYGLHFAKTVLKLNPIAYTYDWGMITDIARRNQSRLTAALGVEHLVVSADIPKKRANIRKNVLAWLEKPDIAMVPLFMAGDKQAEYYAEELKRKTGIKLIIYSRGNQLEDERFKFGYYGIFDGTPRGVLHDLSPAGKLKMAAYFARACLVNPKYINSSLTDTAFAYTTSYLVPHKDFIYLWHYIPWKETEIVSTIKSKYGWETAKDTVATWRIDDGTPPFYNYIYYHIQGFTEHDGLRSNQIREGHITRNKALELVFEENQPRYESLQWYFDTIGVDGDKALSVIDNISPKY